MFHFSTYHLSSLKHFFYLSANFWMPDAKNNAGCCPCHWRTTDCTSVSDTNFCPPSIFTPNMNCSLCRALVAIYWMHLRVNLICIKSFWPTLYFFGHENTMMACCSLRENFSGNVVVSNVHKCLSQWSHKIHRCYSELNSLQKDILDF